MKAFILSFLTVVAALGASGDIQSVSVDANGYTALVTIRGLNTGGTYSFGFGSNNKPSSTTPYLTVTDQGYDSAGTAVARTRRVYMTKQVRKPYNQDANIDESYSAPDLTVRVALSGPIFQGSSTNLTATFPTGWYAQGGTNSVANSSVSVTDNSTLGYPKTLGKWKQAPFEMLTGSSFKLYFESYNQFGISGVKFTAADTSSHTVTSTQTATSLDDRSFPGGIRPSWYIADISLSTLTQGNTITCNAVAYPYIGDSTSILDTSDGVNTMPTPNYAPLTFVNNKTGAIATMYACVDATNGNDATGVVRGGDPNSSFNNASPFQTIGNAAKALVTANSTTNSRAHLGYTFICLTNGNHAWIGSSPGYANLGGVPDTWCTIQNYPGGSGAAINAQSGNYHLQNGSSGKLKFKGVSITTTTVDTFDSCGYMWFNQCTLNSNTDAVIDLNLLSYWTFNTVGSSGWKLGFNATSIHNNPPALVLGNTMTHMPASAVRQIAYNVSGNYMGPSTTGKAVWGSTIASTSAPQSAGSIFSFNSLCMTNGSGTVFSLFASETNALGCAFVNNLIECINDSGTDIALVIGGDVSTGDPLKNVLLWGNTFAGNRWNYAYNDSGSTAPNRSLWSVWGNVNECYAIKSDTFTGSGGANGVRTNNWPVLYGMSHRKNLFTVGSGVTAAGSFMLEFSGINTDAPAIAATQPPTSTARALTYTAFVNRAAYSGSAGAGGGDYHLKNTSPAVLLDDDFCPLLFDIEGVYRGGFTSPGAYSSASPRRGGGFF